MTALSSRFAPHLLFLVLGLVAIAFATGRDRTQPDGCADPVALQQAREFGAERGFDDHASMPEGTLQWSHGVVPITEPVPFEVELTVMRTYAPTAVFLRPLSVPRAKVLADRSEFDWVDAAGTRLPVHLRYEDASPQPKVAAYFYVYDGALVEQPFVSRLLDSPDLLLNGAKPLSVIMAVAPVPLRRPDVARDAATRVLERAWRTYESACGSEAVALDAS